MTEPWNLRSAAHPLIRGAGRQLERLNARHPWDHNAHFHPWILRHLPVDAHRVLDVGCGRGDLLAALSTRAARVEGIDPDPGMAYSAATAHRDRHSVHILRRTLSEHASQTGRAPAYDAITLVASLHHLDLGTALRQVRDLLRPGGTVLVVTLVRPVSILDHAWDVANALTNPVIGILKHPRPVPPPEREPGSALSSRMPVRDATFSLALLHEQARAVLGPGAVIRRREGFRVTLRWQKPGRPRGELSGGHDAGR